MSVVLDIPVLAPIEEVSPKSLLEDLKTGDPVSLEDGEYVTGKYIYYVENQRIQTIFSALTDENQLSLDLFSNMDVK